MYPGDIQFLRSRVAGRRPDQPKVSSKNFRNVAIICGIHTQKDMINQLGCDRFAIETGQKLTNFYSIDKWSKGADPADKKGRVGLKNLLSSPSTSQIRLNLMTRRRFGSFVMGQLRAVLEVLDGLMVVWMNFTL